MNTRSGKFIKNLSAELAYKSFVPAPLPPNPKIELDSDTISLLIQANKQLAILENMAKNLPHVYLFVYMYIRKEALLSSQIEGTQATLEDILDPEIVKSENKDVMDVTNYIKATEFSLRELQNLPICNRFIRGIHFKLMQGVRGAEKNPGEFRRSQNWIGGQGSTIKNARYIPPNVEDMKKAMSDLEKYINQNDDLDTLIRAALIHYQFETIHPFLDGNGRVGRLLITLFLIQNETLTTPALYISYFLKKNRIEYYDRMTEVREKGNYEQWIKFFLEAVYESAKDAIQTIHTLNNLRDKNISKIEQMSYNSETVKQVLLYAETKPFVVIQETANALEMTFGKVSRAVQKLVEAEILVQLGNTRRKRTFVYKDYIEILKLGT